jgi:hypothetical protein
MEIALPLIIFLVVTTIIVTVAIVAANRQRSGKSGQMGKLAHALNLDLFGGEPFFPRISWLSWIRKPYTIEGILRSRNTKIYHYTVSHGKSSTTYAAIRVAVDNPIGITFSFAEEGLLSKIGRSLGIEDVSIGDARFDKEFIVKGKPPEFLRTVLIPEIREKFYEAWDRGARGILKLRGTEISYDEVGSITRDPVRKRFELLAEIACDLADALEVFSGETERGGVRGKVS